MFTVWAFSWSSGFSLFITSLWFLFQFGVSLFESFKELTFMWARINSMCRKYCHLRFWITQYLCFVYMMYRNLIFRDSWKKANLSRPRENLSHNFLLTCVSNIPAHARTVSHVLQIFYTSAFFMPSQIRYFGYKTNGKKKNLRNVSANGLDFVICVNNVKRYVRSFVVLRT